MNSDQWTQARQEILSRLDIVEEYKRLGVDVIESGNGEEWAKCRAIGRDDRNPSAGINVSRTTLRGLYRDLGSDEQAISLFEFAATKAGRYATWFEAMISYADQTGVTLPKKKHPSDAIVPVAYNSNLARLWFDGKLPITEAAFLRCGGLLAKHPGKNGDVRITLPIYGVGLDSEPPIGYVIWHRMGKEIEFKSGNEIIRRKMQTISGSESGLMGLRGLKAIRGAEIVFKAEGPTDVVTLESMIPEADLSKYAVVTNSGGANEKPKKWQVDFFYHKRVVVVPDCDEPGQKGGRRWAEQIATQAADVRILQLPFNITENHGKDLRDYFNEGNTFADFLKLVETAEKVTKVENLNESSDDEALLTELKIEVLGENDGEITIFSHHYKKISTIKAINRFSYDDLILSAGSIVREKVLPGILDDDTHYSFQQVKYAIATVAGGRRIYSNLSRGQGIWENGSHDFVLVGKGEAAVWDGETLERWEKPFCDGLLLDFDNEETFYDFEQLKQTLENFDEEKACEIYKKVMNTFCRWCYLYEQDAGVMPWIITGLIYATWVQSIWDWRPQVSITGASHSGKTTMINFISQCFGKNIAKSVKPTEAGIRQKIGNTSKVLMTDEFEADLNRQRVFELIRSAGSGAVQYRGTPGQKVKEFGLKHIGWFAAIELGVTETADLNRFINVILKKPHHKHQGKLNLPLQEEMQEISHWVMASAIYYGKKVRDIVSNLKYTQMDGIDIRVMEQYALPAAWCSVLEGTPDLTPELFLQQFTASRKVMIQIDLDENVLLQDILEAKARAGGDEYSIGEMIEYYRRETDSNKQDYWVALLSRNGIGIEKTWNLTSNDQGNVFLVPSLIEKYLLHNTKWKGKATRHYLRNIEDVVECRRQISGSKPRGFFDSFGKIHSTRERILNFSYLNSNQTIIIIIFEKRTMIAFRSKMKL